MTTSLYPTYFHPSYGRSGPSGPIGSPTIWVTVAVVGLVLFLIRRRVTRDSHRAVRGHMLAYRGPDARASYRDRVDLSVGDLLAALERLGYRLQTAAADLRGCRAGALDRRAPLVGANLLWRAPGWRTWIRVQLPTIGSEPTRPGARLLGLLEMQGAETPAAEEAYLFTLRALDELLGGVSAGPVDARVSPEPASRLTEDLPPRPALAAG
jgi:hypothetical protein